MKFRAERDALLNVLTIAGRGANGSTGQPPTLYLNLNNDELAVTGANSDLSITSKCAVSGGDDGTLALPSRLVSEIVKSLGAGAVEFVGETGEVRITSGRAEFSVRTVVGSELQQPKQPSGDVVTVSAVPFAEGLRQVTRAALSDDTRAPQLTGVLATPTDTGLRLVATDSYRLAIRDIHGISGLSNDDEGMLIPSMALNELHRLIGDDDTDVLVTRDEHSATFVIGETSITTRLLAGEFPQYQVLIPDSYKNVLTVNRVALVDALKRVRVMIRDTKDASTPVRLSFSSNGVELNVQAPEIGNATDGVSGKYVGDDTTIAFNPTYLLDGLDAIQSDSVTLSIIDTNKPATLKSADNDDYSYLIMPVRIS